MRIGEHLLPFHTEPYECIDVEEPPVDEILFRCSPVRESEILPLQKFVEPVSVPVQLLISSSMASAIWGTSFTRLSRRP